MVISMCFDSNLVFDYCKEFIKNYLIKELAFKLD